MGGKGFAPKDEDRKARGNKPPTALRVVEIKPVDQPDLPLGIEWHPQTIVWWHMWGNSALASEFTEVEWNYLTETALLHTQFWNGAMSLAGELRLRAAKFGATPEDRARLRIQVVTAQEAEDKADARASVPSSRGRYTAPKAVS